MYVKSLKVFLQIFYKAELPQEGILFRTSLGIFINKQDSKELSPRPLENAPKTFNSIKLFKILMFKGSLSF